jgi:lipoate-protein ligase A
MMSNEWRLLISPPASGRRNMAVDEAILDSVAGGQSSPTLRLYAWDPACLSLGHAQPADVVDEPAVAEAGWDVVRRPTGGRALLHTDELTYSISAPASMPGLSEGVVPSYRHLSRGLLAGLQHLGLRPDAPGLTVVGEDGLRNPICFEVPSAYEITVGGRKILGSAQLRRRGALLQHGSLPLSGDITRVVRALSFPDESTRREAADRLRRHATTVEEALGRAVPFDEAARAVVEGFANGLGWNMAEGELTEAEESLARQLEASLYRRAVPAPDSPRPTDGRLR